MSIQDDNRDDESIQDDRPCHGICCSRAGDDESIQDETPSLAALASEV
jgi:hypothetical protein